LNVVWFAAFPFYLVQEMFQQHSILKLLAQMSIMALKLLQQATPKERSKVPLLSAFLEVQMLLQYWHAGWRCCYDASEDAAAFAAQQQLALRQIQQTGKCSHCTLTITRLIHHPMPYRSASCAGYVCPLVCY
jgi:hypothetical protein